MQMCLVFPKRKEGNKMSTTEKALKAIAEAETLKQSAIKELLAEIKDAEKKLTDLGYSQTTTKPAGKGKQVRTVDPNAPCPICKFVTVPPHNGRQHRTIKKAFNTAQLAELGLKKKG